MFKKLVCIDYAGTLTAAKWRSLMEKTEAQGHEAWVLTSADSNEFKMSDWEYVQSQGFSKDKVIFSADKSSVACYKRLAKDRGTDVAHIILIDDGQSLPRPKNETDNWHIRAARKAGAAGIHFDYDTTTVENVEQIVERFFAYEPPPKPWTLPGFKPRTVAFSYDALTCVYHACVDPIATLKENKHDVCLVTSVSKSEMQENERYLEYITQHGIDHDRIVYDAKEEDPAFYGELPTLLNVNKDALVLVDIEPENLAIARQVGIQTVLYDRGAGIASIDKGLVAVGVFPTPKPFLFS